MKSALDLSLVWSHFPVVKTNYVGCNMPGTYVMDSACCQHCDNFHWLFSVFLHSLCIEDEKSLQLLWGFFDSSEVFKHTFFHGKGAHKKRIVSNFVLVFWCSWPEYKGTFLLFFFSLIFCLPACLRLKDRYLSRKAGASSKMENATPFHPNYYNFEIKGLSGKKMWNKNNSSLKIYINI